MLMVLAEAPMRKHANELTMLCRLVFASARGTGY